MPADAPARNRLMPSSASRIVPLSPSRARGQQRFPQLGQAVERDEFVGGDIGNGRHGRSVTEPARHARAAKNAECAGAAIIIAGGPRPDRASAPHRLLLDHRVQHPFQAGRIGRRIRVAHFDHAQPIAHARLEIEAGDIAIPELPGLGRAVTHLVAHGAAGAGIAGHPLGIDVHELFGPIWPPVAGSIRRPKSSVSPEDSSSVRRRGLPVLSSVLDVMRVRPSRKSCSNRMASGLQAIMADTGRERTISSPLATVGRVVLIAAAKAADHGRALVMDEADRDGPRGLRRMGNLAQGAAGSRPAGQVPAGLRVHVGRGGGLEARILRARAARRRCAGGKTDGERAGSEPTQAGGYGHGRSPEIDVKRPYRRPDIVGKAHGRHAGGKQTETPGRQAAQVGGSSRRTNSSTSPPRRLKVR